MKLLPTIVLALSAAVSCAAGAATYGSDQDRRDQNREEALSRWRADHGSMSSSSSSDRSTTSTGRSSVRERAREGAETVRDKTHKGAQSVRHFTHRQAEKARNFSERQDRRYGTKARTPNTSPEGGGK